MMKQQHRIQSIVAGLAWGAMRLSAPGVSAETQTHGQPPNIIFFIVDDQRMERVNYTPQDRDEEGRPMNLMPTVDRLVAEGAVFDNLHTPSPICVPTRFSVLTGTYAGRAQNAEMVDKLAAHGYPCVGQNAYILPGRTTTLAHRLHDAGYATGMVGKNHVVEVEGWKPSRHDDDIHDPRVQQRLIENQDNIREAFHASGFDYAERLYHDNLHGNGPGALLAHNLDWITEGALQFIEQNRGQPFYLYFSSTLPHGPSDPPRTWQADRRITPVGLLDEPMHLLPSAADIRKQLKDAGIEDLRKGNELWIDSALAALVTKLEEEGIADRTVIVYMNDHGVEAGKSTVYQAGCIRMASSGLGLPSCKGDDASRRC